MGTVIGVDDGMIAKNLVGGKEIYLGELTRLYISGEMGRGLMGISIASGFCGTINEYTICSRSSQKRQSPTKTSILCIVIT
jgi:hypothetical protein